MEPTPGKSMHDVFFQFLASYWTIWYGVDWDRAGDPPVTWPERGLVLVGRRRSPFDGLFLRSALPGPLSLIAEDCCTGIPLPEGLHRALGHLVTGPGGATPAVQDHVSGLLQRRRMTAIFLPGGLEAESGFLDVLEEMRVRLGFHLVPFSMRGADQIFVGNQGIPKIGSLEIRLATMLPDLPVDQPLSRVEIQGVLDRLDLADPLHIDDADDSLSTAEEDKGPAEEGSD